MFPGQGINPHDLVLSLKVEILPLRNNKKKNYILLLVLTNSDWCLWSGASLPWHAQPTWGQRSICHRECLASSLNLNLCSKILPLVKLGIELVKEGAEFLLVLFSFEHLLTHSGCRLYSAQAGQFLSDKAART